MALGRAATRDGIACARLVIPPTYTLIEAGYKSQQRTYCPVLANKLLFKPTKFYAAIGCSLKYSTKVSSSAAAQTSTTSGLQILYETLALQSFTCDDVDAIVKRMPALAENFDPTPTNGGASEQRTRLFNRVHELKILGLTSKAVKELLLHYPHVLLMDDVGWIAGQLHTLTEWFPKKDLAVILSENPHILLEKWKDIRDRVYYAHFRMGIDQGDMAKANMFHHSFEHLKARHLFLSIIGGWQFPVKKRKEGRTNPSMRKLLETSDGYFAEKVAGVTKEEYIMFKHLWQDTIKNRHDLEFFEDYPFPIRSVPKFDDVWNAKTLRDDDFDVEVQNSGEDETAFIDEEEEDGDDENVGDDDVEEAGDADEKMSSSKTPVTATSSKASPTTTSDKSSTAAPKPWVRPVYSWEREQPKHYRWNR